VEWVRDDGGRSVAGFKGDTGDCVTRALAIATGMPYRTVYDELFERQRVFSGGRSRKARRIRERGATPRQGVFREVYQAFLEEVGWRWVPTMKIGSGCQVHLRSDELPGGTIICRLSKHIATVKDGVVHDIHDPSRDGTRCVYGYFEREAA